MPTINRVDLEKFAIALLAAGGATDEEANVVGRSLVAANLCGYDSHGVMRIPFYLDMLRRGDIVSNVELKTVSETDSLLVADAQWGFGRVQAGRLFDQLAEKAGNTGVATGTLAQAAHIGRLGEYCEIAAEQGLLSMVMANTHGASRRVAPPGGIAPRLGTNPIALGVPHDDGPIVLDFSTSATAEGKVRVKQIAGEQCPEGWLLDSSGQPTTDPDSLYADPPGTIRPMGGDQAYKGFGLSLMIDIFAGALSGGLVARETAITPKGNCVFVMLASPDRFAGREHFVEQLQQLVAFVRGCPTATGVDKILLPGDPERETRARKEFDGLAFDDENWNQLIELGRTLNVSP